MHYSANLSRHARAALTAGAVAFCGILTPSLVPTSAQAPGISSASSAGSSALSPLDDLGRPTAATQERIRAFAAQPFLPQDFRNAVLSALNFAAGDGTGGPALVSDPNLKFTQFYWPTVSANCIGGSLDAVGSAIAVPGPTTIPAPGAGPGETAFLFTALGTSPAAPNQGLMKVHWFNLNTFGFGTTELTNNGINPDGPTTVSGRAATGYDTIVAVVEGAAVTSDSTCSFAPTATIFEVR